MPGTESSSRRTWRVRTCTAAWRSYRNCTRSPASMSVVDIHLLTPLLRGAAMNSPHCLRRATTSVLVAVALIAGATLLLGDRFGSVPSHALTQTVRAGAPVAACVAEENMRLITVGRDRCQPGELELASSANDAGRAELVAPGVSAVTGGQGIPGP